MTKSIIFPDCGVFDAIIIRIRDASYSHNPTRGVLVMTPMEMDFKDAYSVYRMDSYTFVVAKYKWESHSDIKEGNMTW